MILLLCQTTDVSQLINVIAAVTAVAAAYAASSFPCLYIEGLRGSAHSARHKEGETQNRGTNCIRCNVNHVYLTEIAFIIKVHTWVGCKTAPCRFKMNLQLSTRI